MCRPEQPVRVSGLGSSATRAISVRSSKTTKFCRSFTRTPLASQRPADWSHGTRSQILLSQTSISEATVAMRQSLLASQTRLRLEPGPISRPGDSVSCCATKAVQIDQWFRAESPSIVLAVVAPRVFGGAAMRCRYSILLNGPLHRIPVVRHSERDPPGSTVMAVTWGRVGPHQGGLAGPSPV